MRARSGVAGGSIGLPANAGGDGLRVRTLRPRRSLLRRTALQTAFVALPLIGIAAWSEQQFSPGTLSALVWSVLVVVALMIYLVVRYRRTEISVSPVGLVERGFFGRLNPVAARDVASVLRVQLYRGTSEETSPQLFLVGADGRCLLRMRGAFWDEESMDAVAASLGVEQVVRPTPVTMSELRASDPGLLYWFERRFARVRR